MPIAHNFDMDESDRKQIGWRATKMGGRKAPQGWSSVRKHGRSPEGKRNYSSTYHSLDPVLRSCRNTARSQSMSARRGRDHRTGRRSRRSHRRYTIQHPHPRLCKDLRPIHITRSQAPRTPSWCRRCERRLQPRGCHYAWRIRCLGWNSVRRCKGEQRDETREGGSNQGRLRFCCQELDLEWATIESESECLCG